MSSCELWSAPVPIWEPSQPLIDALGLVEAAAYEAEERTAAYRREHPRTEQRPIGAGLLRSAIPIGPGNWI